MELLLFLLLLRPLRRRVQDFFPGLVLTILTGMVVGLVMLFLLVMLFSPLSLDLGLYYLTNILVPELPGRFLHPLVRMVVLGVRTAISFSLPTTKVASDSLSSILLLFSVSGHEPGIPTNSSQSTSLT